MKIKWLDRPRKHDYPAAASYLSLTLDAAAAKAAAEQLKKAEMTAFAAKDMFRASDCHCSGSATAPWKKTARGSPAVKSCRRCCYTETGPRAS